MADFEKAIEIVLFNEGGYVNDCRDSGGETKFGISKKAYPSIDIKNLTKEKAKEIYRKDYWELNRYYEISSQDIANKVFDLAINIGSYNANKILQKTVNFIESYTIAVDGIIGEHTLEGLNGKSEYGIRLFVAIFERLAAKYYVELNNQRYIIGWLNRLFR